MKKILVSDYDQTFYLNDEDIEKNKTSVKKFRDKGNIFIFATGRSYMDFMKKELLAQRPPANVMQWAKENREIL